MMKDNFEERLEELIEYYLEDESLEDFLERFDLTSKEVIFHLFYTGMIGHNDLEPLWIS